MVPVSELKQRPGKTLSKATIDRQDVIIERYGEKYAVILSIDRYQKLVEAAQTRVRERFLAAQQDVYAITENIPANELDSLISEAIQESRRQRAGLDESNT